MRKLVVGRIDCQEEAAGSFENKQGQWKMTKKDHGICHKVRLIFTNREPMMYCQHKKSKTRDQLKLYCPIYGDAAKPKYIRWYAFGMQLAQNKSLHNVGGGIKQRPAVATPRGLLPLVNSAAPCKDAIDKANERRKLNTLIQHKSKTYSKPSESCAPYLWSPPQ